MVVGTRHSPNGGEEQSAQQPNARGPRRTLMRCFGEPLVSFQSHFKGSSFKSSQGVPQLWQTRSPDGSAIHYRKRPNSGAQPPKQQLIGVQRNSIFHPHLA